MGRLHHGVDAAPDEPVGANGHAPGGHGLDQVVEDAVGDVLVEGALVPVAPQVELQRLELDDGRAWDIGDGDGGEVGLTRHGTHAGELRGLAAHLVVPPRVGVGHRHELPGGAGGHRATVPPDHRRAGAWPAPARRCQRVCGSAAGSLALAQHAVHLGAAHRAAALGGAPAVGQLDLVAVELTLLPALDAVALVAAHGFASLSAPMDRTPPGRPQSGYALFATINYQSIPVGVEEQRLAGN